MSNMLKSFMVCAAVVYAFASVPAHADIKNMEVYGQAAISAYSLMPEHGDATTGLENESRVGFRGSVELPRAPKLIWQIEGGNVNDGSGNSGRLGVRDTYIGFEGSFGKVRFGRLLTPLYQIVDWPYSNPGLGNVFDWGSGLSAGAYYDRQSDQVRWDSPTWSGFSLNLASGKGNVSKDDNIFFGAAAHYTYGPATVHAGVEADQGRDYTDANKNTTDVDTMAAIGGAEVWLKNGLAFMGAYKYQQADYNQKITDAGDKQKVNSFSVIAQYGGVKNFIFKAGYAANSDVEQDGTDLADTADYVVSGQILYFLGDPALTYLRVKGMEINDTKYTEIRLGLEYYF